jgi:hypothetical protein
MPAVSLTDAVVLLFVAWLVIRAGRRTLGESLHDLIGLLLIIGLFLGFRLAREIRGLLADMAVTAELLPSLGTALLVVVAAWLLLRLVRRRSGAWIERLVPGKRRRPLTRMVELVRGLLLAGFLLWLVEGLYPRPPAPTPLAVNAVRAGDRWLHALTADPAGARAGPRGESTRAPMPAPPATPPISPYPPAYAWPNPPRTSADD